MGLITIQALGRHCYLGQLCNAASTTLIPGFRLFSSSEIKSIRTSAQSTDVKYEEVKSLKEKAQSLNISSHLSVSILSGALDISGMGSYLQTDKESTDSTTVVIVGRYRTYSESLDINQLRSLEAMTNEELVRLGATHVVTSITYGGNVVASLTQKQDLSDSDRNVGGKFSLEAFKGIAVGEMFGAGTSAELSVENKKKIGSYKLLVKLNADFFSQGDEVPIDAPALLTAFKNSPRRIGEGVACEVVLTPLSWLQSNIPSFCELSDADLHQLTNLYDEIILLGQNRSALFADVLEQEDLFPSFLALCRSRNVEVNHLIQEARQELRSFLEATRSGKRDVKSPFEFRKVVEERFHKEILQYHQDHGRWLSITERVRAAKKHGFPPASISKLRTIMTGQGKGTVAIVLIPESVPFSTLLVTYGELAEDIWKWRTIIDEKSNGGELGSGDKTKFVSVYADELVDQALLELDDETKSIKHALTTARDKCSPVFLTHGPTRDTLVQLKWSLLNQEGWGVLINRREAWRYIGDVHRGVRHGVGVITYADGSVYQGDWFEGKRDGLGEIFPPQKKREAGEKLEGGSKGVYVDNICVSDGVVVKVTVVQGGSPIQFSRVALRKGDASVTNVDKIGRVLGWQLGSRYRLKMETGGKDQGFEIVVNGARIDPSEEPGVESIAWPFEDTDVEKQVTAIALSYRRI